MLKYRVIPCLTIKGNELVKTIKFKKPIYVGDPINTIKIFNDKEVDELVLLDITATREKKGPNFKLLNDVSSECFMPLGYGGGITNLMEIEKLFNLGIEKVILNSSTYSNINLLKSAVETFGSQSIVASIDVKKSWFSKKQTVWTQCGEKNTKLTPLQYSNIVEEAGAGEIIINSIDLDGSMLGYDLNLIQTVSNAVKTPVVALGGAGSLNDFRLAKNAGASAFAASSFFIFQKAHRAVLITYPTREELDTI